MKLKAWTELLEVSHVVCLCVSDGLSTIIILSVGMWLCDMISPVDCIAAESSSAHSDSPALGQQTNYEQQKVKNSKSKLRKMILWWSKYNIKTNVISTILFFYYRLN